MMYHWYSFWFISIHFTLVKLTSLSMHIYFVHHWYSPVLCHVSFPVLGVLIHYYYKFRKPSVNLQNKVCNLIWIGINNSYCYFLFTCTVSNLSLFSVAAVGLVYMYGFVCLGLLMICLTCYGVHLVLLLRYFGLVTALLFLPTIMDKI